MNTYQEALITLYECSLGKVSSVEEEKAYQTLQELIDKTTICGLSLDEAIPVIEMYKELKCAARQIEPIEDLMMGQRGQYYINGHSVEEIIREAQRTGIENIELKEIMKLKDKLLKESEEK